MASNVIGNIDESDDVNCKLAKDRADDVWVEDVRLWALFGESFDGLEKTLVYGGQRTWEVRTFAREIERKQTLMSMPLIVTCPSPNLMPSR